jgi:hypothetical protein
LTAAACLLGMVDSFATVLQQSTKIFNTCFVCIIGPGSRADVCAGIRQVERRNNCALVRKVANEMIAAEIVPVGRNQVVTGEI